MTGRVRWWSVLALLAIVLVGCGDGSTTPSVPAPTGGPSASAPILGEAELAVCDGTTRMNQGVDELHQVRLRRGAGDSLTSALDRVVEGQRLVLEYATGRMRTRVRTLGFAVANITIAVEDFRTTDRYDEAAANIKRRTTALRRAVEAFRTWVGCPEDTTTEASAAPGASPAI